MTTEPVPVGLEITTERNIHILLVLVGVVTWRVTVRNTSSYGIQLKSSSGNMALAPGAVSDTFIFHRAVSGTNIVVAQFLSSLELLTVIDGHGNQIVLYNLDKAILPNTTHCTLCFIPLC